MKALNQLVSGAALNLSMKSPQSKLDELRPTRKPNVMDLLREVGHDVDYWSVNADGSMVETPAANPYYCYK